jgi:hypothetical protein
VTRSSAASVEAATHTSSLRGGRPTERSGKAWPFALLPPAESAGSVRACRRIVQRASGAGQSAEPDSFHNQKPLPGIVAHERSSGRGGLAPHRTRATAALSSSCLLLYVRGHTHVRRQREASGPTFRTAAGSACLLQRGRPRTPTSRPRIASGRDSQDRDSETARIETARTERARPPGPRRPGTRGPMHATNPPSSPSTRAAPGTHHAACCPQEPAPPALATRAVASRARRTAKKLRASDAYRIQIHGRDRDVDEAEGTDSTPRPGGADGLRLGARLVARRGEGK